MLELSGGVGSLPQAPRWNAFLISCAGRDRDGAGPTAGGRPTGSGPELFVFRGAKLGYERAARTLCLVIASASEAIPLRARGSIASSRSRVIGPATSGRTHWLLRYFGGEQSDSLRW
jgi:hypothetical protein